ncbi:hypothetical protein RFI_06003, partial [Reticulomyxa filosa]
MLVCTSTSCLSRQSSFLKTVSSCTILFYFNHVFSKRPQAKVVTTTTTTTTTTEDNGRKDEQQATKNRFKPYKELSKWNLSCLNGFVTGSTAFVSSGGYLPVSVSAMIGCISLATSASALNQLQEHPFDRQMNRTRLKRPLCNGQLTAIQAKAFITLSMATGCYTLATYCGTVSALIGMSTILLYNVIYTPLKRLTPYNTEFGAIVGAFPPQIGIAASHWKEHPTAPVMDIFVNTINDPLCWFTFALLYVWQMPHFLYLSIRNKQDYIRGGFRMWSHNLYDNANNTRCKKKSFYWSLCLPVLPLGLSYAGATSYMFALDGGLLSLAYVTSVYRWYRNTDSHSNHALGKTSFLFNLMYLPFILLLMLIHSKRWKYQPGKGGGGGGSFIIYTYMMLFVFTLCPCTGSFWSTHLAWLQDQGIYWCPWDNTSKQPSDLPSEM